MSRFHLESNRFFPVCPDRVFEAWTKASELKLWWGPPDVQCTHASMDIRVGGNYRIANKLPDGSTLWIEGTYQQIEKTKLLVFTWKIASGPDELVTVRFDAQDGGTLVRVTHERIHTDELRTRHLQGWQGCLNGLERHLSH